MLRRLSVLAGSALLALPLGAAQRTFVSAGTGTDANPCTRSAPCRSFTAALATTDPGGEVVVLDSGGYGPFTVSASATIDAPPGVAAAITVFSGTGITFSGGAGDRLALRGLQLTGLGGSMGVVFSMGAAVHLERVLATGFTVGVQSGFSSGMLTVDDCALIGNYNGMQIGGGTAESGAVITGSRFEGNSNVGLYALDQSEVASSDSVFTKNVIGLGAQAGAVSTTANVIVERGIFSGNSIAIVTFSSSGVSKVWVSDSTIALNGTGVSAGHSVAAPIFSRANNTLQANVSNGAFTGVFVTD